MVQASPELAIRTHLRLKALEDMLREVLDEGLIYWEPNTERGHAAKADMIARISKLLTNSQ